MYVDIGYDLAVRAGQVLGVFDLDNTSWSKRTREFLQRVKIVLMRTGQRLPGVQLRAIVRLLMFQNLRKYRLPVGKRICDCADGMIRKRQLLAPAGKFTVIRGSRFSKRF